MLWCRFPSALLPMLVHALLFAPAYRAVRLYSALSLYVLILVIGSIPGARADIGQLASGYVLHSTAYATIAWLLVTGTRGSLGLRIVQAVLGVALMGALDETVQSFFPYRHSDIRDWMVDCAAALVTCALASLVLPRTRQD
jgi:VanZ family protein